MKEDPLPILLNTGSFEVNEITIGLVLYILVVLVLIFLSALISGSEVSFFSLSSHNLEELSEIDERTFKEKIPPGTGQNWAAYAGLHDISGYHPAKLKNYAHFEPYINALRKGQTTYVGINLLKLLNVKQIVNWENGKWNTLLLDSIGFKSLDRSFFINELSQYNKDDELLNQMNLEYFNPTELSYTKNEIPEFYPKDSESKIINYNWSPNKIEIEVDIKNHNHFIGLSEIYYPNWEITSHDIEIIQINGILRGFVTPKGKHTIVMEFNYNDVQYASTVSFLSFILMLLCILSTFLLTKNKSKI